MVKVLMVLTSHDQLGNTGRKTGFWLEELAAPYYVFKDAGAQITLASPKGGRPPLDPKSNEPSFQTDITRWFEKDADAEAQLNRTVRLEGVKQEDYDTVFYPGGHGPMWDIAEDKNSIKLIESFLAAGKPVALVCHAPGALRRLGAQLILEAGIGAQRVALEDLLLVLGRKPRRVVDVALGVVEILSGLRILAAHRADHLRGEQDIVDRHHLGHEVDAGLMIDAGVEPHVVLHHLVERRPLVVERQAAVAAPVERHRAAAVGDDQLQGGEILEQVAHDELHERGGIGVDVVRAGAVKGRIARRAHVHHRGHVELHHLLVEFVPPAVGQRRRGPAAPRGSGVEVAAVATAFLDAALALTDATIPRHAQPLRQLAPAHA